MTRLMTQSTAAQEWQRLVLEARDLAHLRLSHENEGYLVNLLIRQLRRPELFDRVMAMDYLHAMEERGALRRERLREVGDGCLLFAGLFPGMARRRMVSSAYFAGLGRSAYRVLGESMRGSAGELYSRLAEGFVSMMDVLQAMAGMREPRPLLQPLEAYDLWRQTNSIQARRALQTPARSLPLYTRLPTTMH